MRGGVEEHCERRRGRDAVHLTCFFRTPSGDHAGGQMWRLTWIVFVSLFIYGTSAQGGIQRLPSSGGKTGSVEMTSLSISLQPPPPPSPALLPKCSWIGSWGQEMWDFNWALHRLCPQPPPLGAGTTQDAVLEVTFIAAAVARRGAEHPLSAGAAAVLWSAPRQC
ncbi:unnamed protein product [Arctogadus glacialis]